MGTLEDDILRAIMGTPLDKEAQIDGILKEHKIEGDAVTVLKGIVKLAKAYEDLLPKDTPTIIAKCAGYLAPAPAPAAGQGEKKGEEEDKNKTGYGFPIKKSVDGEYDLSGVPAEMQPIMKELWIEREARQALTDQAITKELEEVITKELSGLPIGEGFIPVLKGVREKAPDEYEKLMPVMKAASRSLVRSSLFKTYGRPGAGPSGSAYSRIVAVAKGMVQKSAGELSEDEAICKVMEDPAYDALIQEYEAEQASRAKAADMGCE